MDNIENTKEKDVLKKKLDNFLGDNDTEEKECIGDECLINDGKEIVERVNKVYKTNDGRQLLM
jgi:hypothetical protein